MHGTVARLGRWLQSLRGVGTRAAANESDLGWLSEVVGESVRTPRLYKRALRHRSALRKADADLRSNQRLEFLGDAILGLIVAEHLYQRFPDADEGFLTKTRAKLVNGRSLARCARELGLGAMLEVSANMERIDGRNKKSVLSDAYEALVGALFLDLGIPAVRRFVRRTLFERVDLSTLAATEDNYKSVLLEYCQSNAWPQPTYEVVSEEGPEHDKAFTSRVFVNGLESGIGSAGSKKRAEQMAARAALSKLGVLEEDDDEI